MASRIQQTHIQVNMKNGSGAPIHTIISVITCRPVIMPTLSLELPVQEVARRRPGPPAVVFGRFGSVAGPAGSAGRLLLGADPVQDSFGVGPLNHVLRRLLHHRIRLSEEPGGDQECKYSQRRGWKWSSGHRVLAGGSGGHLLLSSPFSPTVYTRV